MKKQTKYENLALMPDVIAETVTREVYTNKEWGTMQSTSFGEEIEKLRLAMTPEQRKEFVEQVYERCRYLYESGVNPIFVKIFKSKSNWGRDTLYNFVRHWLAGYLKGSPFLKRQA